MAGRSTNVFFVPYRPLSKSKKPPSDNKPVMSQQKHAAREYHRKAKLKRLAKLNVLSNHQTRGISVPALESPSNLSSRPLLPRNRLFQDDQDYTKSFAVFDAGTGQLDPFNACVPSGMPSYVLNILDYATSAQWSPFSSSKGTHNEVTIKNAVLACAMQSPAAFWSIVFAGATHNAYLRHELNAPSRDRTLRLSYKTNAIRELNREIQALQDIASDGLLLAIITMATHGSGEQLDPPQREESLSALESVQNFQYYGRMRWEEAHLKAVCHLVYQRGGLHTVKMPGLANAIRLADIFFALQNLRPPAFPLLAPSRLVMSTWPKPSTPPTPSLNNLTSGFQALHEIREFIPLMEIIANARQITIGFDANLSRQPGAPTLTHIVWARTFLAHDLLSLPSTLPELSFNPSIDTPPCDLSGPDTAISSLHCLYNLIRLSTLTYMLLVLFPLPRVTRPDIKLSQQLMRTLNDCTAQKLWTIHPKLLLWATVLGGIVSGEGSLKSWFAEMIRQARTKVPELALMEPPGRGGSSMRSRERSHGRTRSPPEENLTGKADVEWTVVREICFQFLWFPGPECNGQGKAFWSEACENVVVQTSSD